MSQVHPSMRPKVKGDTFFLTGSDDDVYFRNNEGSFQMKGHSIAQWVEKLLPMFDGTRTLEELTEGLSDSHRDQVYEIARVLLDNGYLRDLSEDLPHQLTDEVLQRQAAQIEFLDRVVGSGAHRLEVYRRAKVLAIGSGPFFVSLVSALLESGLSKFDFLINDEVSTNRERLTELEAYARRSDAEVKLTELDPARNGQRSWQEVVQPYDWLIHVSQEADVEELLSLQAACRQGAKALLPAVCLKQTGLAGPLIHPDADGCWLSMWRRLHRTALGSGSPLTHSFSMTAGAMLANVAVFELFKAITGASPLQNACFLLDLETLEGNWHEFLPHPDVIGLADVQRVDRFESKLDNGPGRQAAERYYSYFQWLTSATSGIFHVWDEEDLTQQPLALCAVQVADPLSIGVADLLPKVVSSAVTHLEARMQAGFAGIESYVSRLIEKTPWKQAAVPSCYVGVGTGGTVAEAIGRGLQACLEHELFRQLTGAPLTIRAVKLEAVEDEFSRFALETLATRKGPPAIGRGADVCGFPVLWVGAGGRWYGGIGATVEWALGKALQKALADVQHPSSTTSLRQPVLEQLSVITEGDPYSLQIPDSSLVGWSEVVLTAMGVLQGQGKRLDVFDLALEPFLQGVLAGVYGVVLREEVGG
ncbi:MAG TPA: putative thiazole-containing bacteriocin maturation protein [Bacilli bacterium]|nr:putative thiazole-containing bacteriocin maturation protein [Bacilli bacterium]